MGDASRKIEPFCAQHVPERFATSFGQPRDLWENLDWGREHPLGGHRFLICFEGIRTGARRITLRLEALILDGETTSSPLTQWI